MDDWQIAVLNEKHIRVDQDQSTGYRLIIRRTDEKNAMHVAEIMATVRNSRRKPVIMMPYNPTRGKFADRKEVLDVLMATEDYAEYLMWMAEARMNGVI